MRRIADARFSVPAMILLLFLSMRFADAGEDVLAERAGQLIYSPAFQRGDRDGGVRDLISRSREHQGTPLAELAVRIAMLYDPRDLPSVTTGEVEARRILSSEAELSHEHRDVLRRFVARSFAASGRREDAKDVHRRRGLGMSWLLAGPFSGRTGAGFETRALSAGGELFEGDVVADPPDAALFRKWRKAPPWRPIPENRAFPYIRPWKGAGVKSDGAMLMYSWVDAEAADNKAEFHIYSETSWRLYVDEALVAEVDRGRREEPVEHMVPYALPPGRHNVVFQVFPPPLGVDRDNVRVAVRLESEAATVWSRPDAPPMTTDTVNARRDARPLRYMIDLEREASRGQPTLMAVYAIACFEQKKHDEAAWWAERAAKANPADANLSHMAGLTAFNDPFFPEGRRRDLANSWHRATLAIQPDIIPSLLYMAKMESEAGRGREAATYIERAYSVNPGSLDVLMARGEWARRFASGATVRAAWDECGKSFPKSPAVQLAIASMPQEGFLDIERRLAACRAAVEAGPYIPDSSLMLAEALAESGSGQDALHVLRNALELFTGEVEVYRRVAEIYASLAMYREAANLIAEAVRITPDSDSLWRLLGDYHMDAGEKDLAEKFWRVSLAANPGQFELADMMDYLSGQETRMFMEGGHDAISITAQAKPDEFASDVVRLLDRSTIWFVEDGSYRRLTHEIDLARTRNGGESLTSIDSQGEILTARIVFPNGNTLEPEPYPGKGGLRLPVIMPGAARELRVLESRSTEGGVTTIAPWFFQDPSGRMPLLVSEYVVKAPRGFPLVYVVNDFGNNVDFEFTQEEAFDVYRWTANLGVPSREPDAVHVSERVPSVEIGVKTTWDDVVFHELRALSGRLVPSMRMRSLLTTLYPAQQGSPDPVQAARSIYRFVCDNIDPTPAGRIAAHIEMDRMGDRSLLLLGLLRAAGLDADPAVARPAAQFMHPPAWDLPSRDIFPVPMVRLSIPGGGTYWLDVRFDSQPFGKITDDLSGATVLSFLPSGPLFETLPSLPAEDSATIRQCIVKLPATEGDVEVSGRSLRRGVSGLIRDRELTEADPITRKTMLLTAVYPVFPDAVLRMFDVQRTDDSEASSLERYEITSKYPLEGHRDDSLSVSLCLLPLEVISTETRNLTRRTTACHIKSVHVAEDHNVFRLPSGGRFLRAPRPAHIPSRFGIYQLRVNRRGDGALEVIRNYHIPAQRIMPWDWADFLSFLERVDLAEKQWIVYSVSEQQ